MASCLFYLRQDIAFGALMTLLLGLTLWCGPAIAARAAAVWLIAGLSLPIIGWAIQSVGHYDEACKPASVDDLTGLIVGPLFVMAEAVFLLGFRQDLTKQSRRR